MTLTGRGATALILASQQAWARDAGIVADKFGYCATPEANLPWLSAAARAEFDAADGYEFGTAGNRAKISALHSSSALAVNFFAYWQDCERLPLERALDLEGEISSITFEQKYPTGVGPRSPNLDIVLTVPGHGIRAIESKFGESFRPSPKSRIQGKYLPEDRRLWERRGLSGAESAARSLSSEPAFEYLDAAQLLKHMLGLASQPSTWHLLLLWYAPTAQLESAMSAEADRFATLLGSDGHHFSALTYQTLWRRLESSLDRQHGVYRDYIRGRYFGVPVV